MRQNVGTWDRYLRISLGLTLLTWSAGTWRRRRGNWANWLGAAVGSGMVAEGMLGWGPVLHLSETSTRETTTFLMPPVEQIADAAERAGDWMEETAEETVAAVAPPARRRGRPPKRAN